jgi:predicted ATP-grasp superfamily ATP-dependent carboligase
MPILVIALSARSLAAAARRAGTPIIAVDLFGDVDTRAMAPWVRLPGDLERGIDRAALREIRVATGDMAGIVYGAGFEHDPALLRELSAMAPLVGNPPEIVAAVKDPWAFATLLKRLDLPHPAISRTPRHDGDWLCKQRGGAGGTHIRPASLTTANGDAVHYYQARAAGQPVSALFAADGHLARVLGFSAQWTAPGRDVPFRFGGCAGPLNLPQHLEDAVARACNALTAATGLVGINSLDLLLDGESWTILEVNPRPGASLDIFDGVGGLSLWDVHCRAVAGALPPPALSRRKRARAAAIVYADRARRVPAVLRWLRWTADVPAPLTTFPAGAPVCTVMAQGPDIESARSLAGRRAGMVLRRLPSLAHVPAPSVQD